MTACGPETDRWGERDLHTLGEDRCLIVAIGNSDTDGGGARTGRCPCVHSDHHKLIRVIGPLIV